MPGLAALRHRPLAQVRSFCTDSAAVTATGTTFCAACTSGTSKSAARRQQERTSAPVHWSSGGNFWLASRPNLRRYICQMAARSAGPRSLSALATPDGTALLVLPNFHRFLQSAEIVQTLVRQINAGKL
jgi:hypothetical protein